MIADLWHSLAWAFGLTLILAGLHLAAPHVRGLPAVPERYTGSFAGGLAVAYVFLHLLPEIAAGNEAVGEALSDVLEPTPLLELAIFLVALAGFTASTAWTASPAPAGPAAAGTARPGHTLCTWVRSWSTTG